MAAQPLLMTPGTVSATGGLNVSGDTDGTATTPSTPAPIANLLVLTTTAVSANAPPLLVKFV